jgi:hypothetical protein
MRRLIPLIVAVLAACVQLLPEEGLAAFLGTRSEAPLEGTVWRCDDPGDYDRYVWIADGELRLFYGDEDVGEIRRWSSFYAAPYALDGGTISVALTYPAYGEKVATRSASVVKAASAYEIDVDGDRFAFVGTDASSFAEWLWITITANIAPPWME